MGRGLSMFDAQARLIVCNKLYSEIYGLPEELTRPGTTLEQIVRFHVKMETGRDDPDDLEKQRKWIENHVAELARGKSFSHTQHLKSGRIVLVSNQPLAGGGWVDIQEDITERRLAEQKIDWLARHDTLTEIANRHHFREQLENWFSAVRAGGGFALHWIDLDHFKEVNDTLGHPVGDALLKSVARRLRKSLRGPDLVARLGGDEFAVLQASAVREADATKLAKRLMRSLAEPHHLLGHQVTAAASIGIALAPIHGSNPEELMKHADLALYEAKSSGRCTYVVFRPEHLGSTGDRHQLEKDLQKAQAKGELEMHYQPIVNLEQGGVTSFEALMRWHHPERGLIEPGEFIPVAEETGFIVEMGEWALRQACKEATTWPEHVKVTVNLSSIQFANGDVFKTVKKALDETGLKPNRLELEITESVLLRDEAKVQDDAAQAPGPRRPDRPRRLRYGLRLSQLPAQLPFRQDQDRSKLHQGSRRPAARRLRRHNSRGSRFGKAAANGRCRRRCRDARSPAHRHVGRMRRAGLLLQQARAGEPGSSRFAERSRAACCPRPSATVAKEAALKATGSAGALNPPCAAPVTAGTARLPRHP